MDRYFLAGSVTCMLAAAFLILGIKTHSDYSNWLTYCKTCLIFNPSQDIIKMYTLIALDFSSMGTTFLIIHFKKWNKSSGFQIRNLVGIQ